MSTGEIQLSNNRGVSRAVVLLALIAAALLIAIIVPVVQNKNDDYARSVDDLYVKAAEDDAYLQWIQTEKPFSAIYDSENKKFIEAEIGRNIIPPYGTSREHEGMVVYVTVDDNGNIRTKWVDQKKEASYR